MIMDVFERHIPIDLQDLVQEEDACFRNVDTGDELHAVMGAWSYKIDSSQQLEHNYSDAETVVILSVGR